MMSRSAAASNGSNSKKNGVDSLSVMQTMDASGVAAAAAAALDGGSEHAATVALISFLRNEADAAEQKANSLRLQAQELAQRFGISQEDQRRYEITPQELPPLDENGVPKYKGKKRGRKPKQRKRKAPSRRRQHTGYTYFMQEKYPIQKSECPTLANKDIIAMVAKQWKGLSTAEKTVWKEKAASTHEDVHDDDEHSGRTMDGDDDAEDNGIAKQPAGQSSEASSSRLGQHEGGEQQQPAEESDVADESYDSEAAPPARRRPRLKKYEEDEEEAAPPARRRRRNA